MAGKENNNRKSFWPLFLVFIVALVLGGVIMLFAYNSSLQDEIDSLYIKIHRPSATSTPPTK